ncbi:hypothetical protein BDR26DRAFT_68304 [Obelidium mucronatum]|nr:hypothetical protein BDR26DRAFT_68304 [Obelidium mucronatum]
MKVPSPYEEVRKASLANTNQQRQQLNAKRVAARTTSTDREEAHLDKRPKTSHGRQVAIEVADSDDEKKPQPQTATKSQKQKPNKKLDVLCYIQTSNGNIVCIKSSTRDGPITLIVGHDVVLFNANIAGIISDIRVVGKQMRVFRSPNYGLGILEIVGGTDAHAFVFLNREESLPFVTRLGGRIRPLPEKEQNQYFDFTSQYSNTGRVSSDLNLVQPTNAPEEEQPTQHKDHSRLVDYNEFEFIDRKHKTELQKLGHLILERIKSNQSQRPR